MNEYEWSGSKSKWRALKATACLSASFVIGGLVWLLLYPIYKYSVVLWLGIVLMGIPVCVLAESIGNLGLDNKYVARWSKGFRIMFGVFWVLLCFAILLLLVNFLSLMVVPPAA